MERDCEVLASAFSQFSVRYRTFATFRNASHSLRWGVYFGA
jgi:hypothetical protein